MKIEEQFLASKTGQSADCEDAICIARDFVAVIDGVSSKTSRRWEGQTVGQTASRTIRSALDTIPADANFRQAADILTAALRDVYLRANCLEEVLRHPAQRAAATLVMVSIARREVWTIGDCQYLLGGEWFGNRKYVDEVTASARAFYLQSELLRGVSPAELAENDPGRAYILELLERQTLFQNNLDAGVYFHAVLDGTPIPDQGLIVREIPRSETTLVLASDGYPVLKPTLRESEQALEEILAADPLLIGRFKSTKCVRPGWSSFDDRAYIRMTLPAAS